jgi:hypothetical protein
MASSGGGSTPVACAGAFGQHVDPQDLGVDKRCRHAPSARSPDDFGADDPEEHRQHLAGVGGQQVAQELTDVGEDPAPLPGWQ